MTETDIEIFRSANLFVELRGDDAVAKARDIVRMMRERRDNDGADKWLRIIIAIGTQQQRANRTLSQ
jgi:hypothetical protein